MVCPEKCLYFHKQRIRPGKSFLCQVSGWNRRLDGVSLRVYKEVSDNWWRQVNIKSLTGMKMELELWNTRIHKQKFALPSGDPGQGDMYQAEDAIFGRRSCKTGGEQ